MTGKSKIQALTSEWYGFNVFSAVVHLVLAVFGSGLFSFFTVPLVIVFSVVSLLITWAIGTLLVRRSSLARIVLLVLSPLAFLGGAVSAWQLVTGPWSLSMLLTLVLVIGGVYMQARSFGTLIDKSVRAYFR
jgi:hypothetical protein